jgi:lipid II:glycine glycyltransferase (peptidoglycan interpeptide bridge formation enzyme)
MLFRRLPLPGRTIAYVPKGPFVALDDADAWSALLTGLRDEARKRGAIFLKIDPDVSVGDSAAVDAIREIGFRLSTDQVQFQSTFLMDLSLDVPELRSRMRRETRNYLNRAQRAGVTIREGGRDDLPLFYEMYRETGHRQSFLIRPREYYLLDWHTFMDAGMATLFIATVDGTPVSGAIIYHLGSRAWYMYGASTSVHREARPNEALQWHVMQWLKERDITTYDLWGAPNTLSPNVRMAGVAQFKKSLGAVWHQWIGAQDLILNPGLYSLWTAWMPRALRVARRVIRAPESSGVPT